MFCLNTTRIFSVFLSQRTSSFQSKTPPHSNTEAHYLERNSSTLNDGRSLCLAAVVTTPRGDLHLIFLSNIMDQFQIIYSFYSGVKPKRQFWTPLISVKTTKFSHYPQSYSKKAPKGFYFNYRIWSRLIPPHTGGICRRK